MTRQSSPKSKANSCLTDTVKNWDMSLMVHARGTIAYKLAIKCSCQDLLQEQQFLRAGSPADSPMWMFHNSMIRELEPGRLLYLASE